MATAPTPFVWGRGGRRMTPEEIAREREIADKLGMQAGDTSPVGHWTQGAARVVNALSGVLADRRANAAADANRQEDLGLRSKVASLLFGGSTPSAGSWDGMAPVEPTTANVASGLLPSGSGMPAQTAMVEGQPPVPGLQTQPTVAGITQAGVDPIAEVVAAGSGSRPKNDWLAYANQGATRSLPVSERLQSALSFLPELGVSMEVFSGGQPRKGTSDKRVGSTRHDDGNAADVFFYKDGRRIDWSNPDDVPIFQEIVRRGRASGLTGFGAGPGYMQPGSMHIGFGNPGVWGAGGSSRNAPKWLVEAFGAPVESSPMPTFDQAMQGRSAASGGIMDAIAPPMSEGYFPPAPSAPQAGGINPVIAEILMSDVASPQTMQMAQLLMDREQQAQERAMQEQQRAQEIQRRQAFLTANNLDPSIAMVDEAWAEAAKAPFRPRNTAVVNGVLVDAETGAPVYQAAPEPTTGMRDYDAYAADVRASGGTPLGRLEYEQALRASGAPRTEAAIPAGYRAVRDAQGNLMSYEPIPGGPAALEAQNAATAAERKQGGQDTASDIVQSAALKAAQALSADGMPATGTLGKAMSFLPESNAAEVRRQVAVLKANATLEGLNAMRASSPTGAALGSVTEGEGEKLAARAGTLDPDSPNFDRDLKDYTKAVLEYIHGPDAGREIYNSMQWGGAADAPQSGDSPPAGVDPEDWKFMTPEERRLFQ